MAICISEKPSGHRAFRNVVFVDVSVPVQVSASVPVCVHARLHGRFRAGLRGQLHRATPEYAGEFVPVFMAGSTPCPYGRGTSPGSHKGHEVGKAITDSIAARQLDIDWWL